MKTDSIFYRLFKELPSIFFELIGNSPQTADAYEFSSIEIKQTAFRIDGVFLPSQGEENPIYFVEVQFQSDEEIYLRVFSEITLYLRQNKSKNPWRGIVIYPSRSIDTADINHYSEFFQSGRVSRIYLDELGETTSLPVGIATIKLIIEDKNTAIVAARDLIARTQQEINIEQQRQLLELIETILVYKFPKMSRKEIEAMFGLSDLKQTRVYQEGVEEGIQEGREEGARQKSLELIPVLLRLGLSLEDTAKELDLDLEEVRKQLENQS
ncbi:Rpn family recombination-promoting nuclease/putative transposase [Rivularia sp. UHCC 0363]|uniref:Rpn family recombination-promoting nuclease/putative transposase n=1 Tax=Rivularia sp. UHCC 0363 TaxID=3110244 RepID=UPI002B20FEA7|nr:Rpn family recombination-promoting nuclease/putative transposase [Rivularia sp. UHCC 0363]MEA5595531.1 Rpn family recombination-promoting nuclease/putative transposase [Rivularia sp. UHCC 0363]